MITFDAFSQEGYLKPFNENPLSSKRSFGIFSSRENYQNNLFSKSKIPPQNSFILNNSNGNINNKSLNSYMYQNSPIIKDINCNSYNDYITLDTNLDYDIRIKQLRQKLRMIKEQNNMTKNNIKSIKIRINKLLSEEKASSRELENTKNRLLKIKTNRKKYFYKKINKNLINLNLSSINNKTMNNANKSSKKKIINNKNNKSQIILKLKNNLNNMDNHNSFRINFNYKKFSDNKFGILSPKMKHFITKNGINNSYDMIQTDNNKKENIEIKSSIFGKKKINNYKSDLRTQIRERIIRKLEENEKEKKKIEEEIKKIEKEQYELWINFNQNFNSGSTESNTNTNNTYKNNIINKNERYKEEFEEEKNIIKYNLL